jgi:hypothetical protein
MRLELMIQILKTAPTYNGLIEISPKFRDSIVEKLEVPQFEAQRYIAKYLADPTNLTDDKVDSITLAIAAACMLFCAFVGYVLGAML